MSTGAAEKDSEDNKYIVEARTNINEQINTLNLLFQQLSFETDTICEIIIAAQGGIMHSSVIAVNELRKQFKDISLVVTKDQSLPFNLNQVSLYELSKISKCNIIYKNETLIFEIIIPLVNSVELTLGYTPQPNLTPSRHLNSTHYKDLISDVGITTNLTIPTSLKRKISSSNTHTNPIIKLTDLGQYSKSIEEIEQLIQEEKDKQNNKNTTDLHSYLFYFILIMVAGILIIKYRHKLTKTCQFKKEYPDVYYT
ncbi:hypothetical protein AGLY_001772 [Aphis glycines]|uniref:Uncharacterized protein n=1 Tax=Aphis glycines TaxID=307491 RepID=A0A6G0U565_APHGL|nr:hypothetical protein AGLY_001772 [Aphis glycines]